MDGSGAAVTLRTTRALRNVTALLLLVPNALAQLVPLNTLFYAVLPAFPLNAPLNVSLPPYGKHPVQYGEKVATKPSGPAVPSA